MLNFSIKSKVIKCEEMSYGLVITYPCGKSREITGISTDKNRISILSQLINSGDVSPCHVDDIIEDFLQ